MKESRSVFGLWWKCKVFALGTLIVHPTTKAFSCDVTQIAMFPPSPVLDLLTFPANILYLPISGANSTIHLLVVVQLCKLDS